MTRADPLPDCPYPGLRPFRDEDAPLFFGRSRQIEEMLVRLETRCLLAVVGVSGCGKSSLVRAGLLPAVWDGFLSSPATAWRIAALRPGRKPFARLARALCEHTPQAEGTPATGPTAPADGVPRPPDPEELEPLLRRGRYGLHEVATALGLGETTGLLVVVDQFEELFRYFDEHLAPGARSREDAHAFVDLLLGANPDADDPPVPTAIAAPGPILIVLTLRSDRLGDCARFAGLPEALNDSQFLTPRLTRDQAWEAIERPAALRGATIEPALVNRFVNDIGEKPDQLPALQLALRRMWTAAAARPDWDRHLTLVDYPKGGVTRAITDQGDETYERLEPDAKNLAKILFCAIADRGGPGGDTRRPQTLAALAEVAGEPDTAALEPVIAAFSDPDCGFLTLSPPGTRTAETLADLVHESIITHWGRLADWMDQEQESSREYLDLVKAARDYDHGNGSLQQGADLRRFRKWRDESRHNAAWAARYAPDHAEAIEYLKTSEDEERKETKRALRRRFTNQGLLIVLGVFCIIVLVSGLYSQELNNQIHSAMESRSKWFAQTARRSVADEPQVSLLLALEANSAAPWLRDTETLIAEVLPAVGGAPLLGHSTGVVAAAFSADGSLLATADRDGTVLLWDPTQPGNDPRRLPVHDAVTAMALAPDGRELAIATRYGEILVWDPTQPEAPPQRLPGHGQSVTALSYSTDGQMLASACADGSVGLWRPAAPDGAPRLSHGHAGRVNALAFSPTASFLFSGGEDGKVLRWDATGSNIESETYLTQTAPITALAWRPDGAVLAVGARDEQVRFWSESEREQPARVLKGHVGEIAVLAFAPDGQTLASAADLTIRLWDLGRDDTEPRVLRGHERAVNGLAFAPDGRTLASAGEDSVVRLWDPAGLNDGPRVLSGHRDRVSAVAYAPDGHTVASGSEDGGILIWDPSDPAAPPVPLQGQAGPVSALAFSPDGRTLAGGGAADGTVRLWDRANLARAGVALTGHTDAVAALTYAPDGTRLATGSWDKTIRLWDLGNPSAAPAVLRGHAGAVQALALGAGMLVSGGADGTIRLWDLEADAGRALGPTGSSEARILRGHEEAVTAVALAPDGTLLASGSDDATIRLWRADGTPAATLTGHDKPVTAVAFSPDGRTLASASWDQSIRLWDVRDPQAAPRVLRGQGLGVSSLAFSPDGRVLASGTWDHRVRLWRLDRSVAELRAQACERLARNLSRGDWQTLFGTEPPVKSCPERPIHPSFLWDADLAAEASAPEGALREYRHILKVFGSIEFVPEERLRAVLEAAAPSKREEGLALAEAGDLAAGLAACAEAARWDPFLPENGMVEARLCRAGGVWAQPGAVAALCDRAIALRPDHPAPWVARAIVRARLGDLTGAAEDLRSAVAMSPDAVGADHDLWGNRRQWLDWLDALEHGRNPFDEKTLQGLR